MKASVAQFATSLKYDKVLLTATRLSSKHAYKPTQARNALLQLSQESDKFGKIYCVSYRSSPKTIDCAFVDDSQIEGLIENMADFICSVDLFGVFSRGVDIFEGLQTDIINYPKIVKNQEKKEPKELISYTPSLAEDQQQDTRRKKKKNESVKREYNTRSSSKRKGKN